MIYHTNSYRQQKLIVLQGESEPQKENLIFALYFEYKRAITAASPIIEV